MPHENRGDLGRLLDLYGDRTPERRLPWNPALLDDDERQALECLVAEFIVDYNSVLAVADDEVIPPCWRKHEGVFRFLAVLVWSWYSVHVDAAATAIAALDFHERHLPLARAELNRLLGRMPTQCRRGEHDENWQKPVVDLLRRSNSNAAPAPAHAATFGFGHI
jgi:hypothetical protein